MKTTSPWFWDLKSEHGGFLTLSENRSVITFHPQGSCGTAVVCGNKAFSDGIHFWELKALSPLYGTDVMVGVGLADTSLPCYIPDFRSALGSDESTWGLSYRGNIIHSGVKNWNASLTFQRGSIVGCLLDLFHGSLQFYVDRRTHSQAQFRDLPRSAYYPMVSSTAGRIGFRLIRTENYQLSLQLLACRAVRLAALDGRYEHIANLRGLPSQLKEFLTNQLPWCLYLRDLKPPSSLHLPKRINHEGHDSDTSESDPFFWISFDDPAEKPTGCNSPDLFEDLDCDHVDGSSSYSETDYFEFSDA